MKMDSRLIIIKRKVDLRKDIMMSTKRDIKISMETTSITNMRRNMKRKLAKKVDLSMVSFIWN